MQGLRVTSRRPYIGQVFVEPSNSFLDDGIVMRTRGASPLSIQLGPQNPVKYMALWGISYTELVPARLLCRRYGAWTQMRISRINFYVQSIVPGTVPGYYYFNIFPSHDLVSVGTADFEDVSQVLSSGLVTAIPHSRPYTATWVPSSPQDFEWKSLVSEDTAFQLLAGYSVQSLEDLLLTTDTRQFAVLTMDISIEVRGFRIPSRSNPPKLKLLKQFSFMGDHESKLGGVESAFTSRDSPRGACQRRVCEA